MKEVGILNSDLAEVISQSGHMDEIIVADAGFPIPLGVRTVDISLAENKPTVLEVLEELKKYYSVEKLVFSNETKEVSPTRFQDICNIIGSDIPVETMPGANISGSKPGGFCPKYGPVKTGNSSGS